MRILPTLASSLLCGLAATVIPHGLASQTPRRFAVADIARIARLSDPQIAPDGRSIALVVARADTAKNSWEYELDGNVGWSYFTGGSPWTAAGEQLTHDQSPISYVRNMKTPTLVISTTGDVRVPVTQSYKLFRALTDLGVETKFVAYPVGGHGPGDPVRLVDWYSKWLEWIEGHDGTAVVP